jgi:hypothetical protein
MRKALLLVVAVFSLAGSAGAQEAYKSYGTVDSTGTTVRLDRSLFDQVGPHVDVRAVCGPAGARDLTVKRSGLDVLVTFLSVGFYTPAHARVVCNQPQAAPVGMR